MNPCEYTPAPLPIVKCIFPNWEMYFFELLIIFVDVEKCISGIEEKVVERGSV